VALSWTLPDGSEMLDAVVLCLTTDAFSKCPQAADNNT